MIIVTGGAGFIGSCVAAELNRAGIDNLMIVDNLGTSDKWKNLRGLRYRRYLDKQELFEFLGAHPPIDGIVHLGACSATTERDAGYLMHNNSQFTLNLARYAIERNIRFVYASSAATYGDGTRGFADDEAQLHLLKPLNMYGYSKHLFDMVAQREGWFDRIAGLKFFNVYGPNEYHKASMRSVVHQAFHQIRAVGRVKLFQSHRADFAHGEQARDFVYVKEVVALLLNLLNSPEVNGLFNAGSGRARTFNDLAKAVFAAVDKPVDIEYIPMPDDVRDQYQYLTQATMAKADGLSLRSAQWSLEDGVADYVTKYLNPGELHLAGVADPF